MGFKLKIYFIVYYDYVFTKTITIAYDVPNINIDGSIIKHLLKK